jgi:transposase
VALESCPEQLAPALRPTLAVVAELTRQIDALEEEVSRLVRTRYSAQTQRLLEVPGVGDLTALAFVLVVGDPENFRRNRDVGPYLGLVPRRDQSGASNPQLGITSCGDEMMRRLLVQCAHHILRPDSPDSDLRRWGLARAARGGKSAKKTAVVAVARRLAVLLLALRRSGAAYVPLKERRAAVA